MTSMSTGVVNNVIRDDVTTGTMYGITNDYTMDIMTDGVTNLMSGKIPGVTDIVTIRND